MLGFCLVDRRRVRRPAITGGHLQRLSQVRQRAGAGRPGRRERRQCVWRLLAGGPLATGRARQHRRARGFRRLRGRRRVGNSTYSNFVRDKGWGMGGRSARSPGTVGGRNITLSHVGRSLFPLNAREPRRWRGWWRYILTDQFASGAPAASWGWLLPALISIQFAPIPSSIAADRKAELGPGDHHRRRHAARPALLGGHASRRCGLMTLRSGLMVLLPSQMSIVDDFSRRWTDIIWSGSRRARANPRAHGHADLLRDPH